MKLYPYQEEGRDFLAARKYALLADEPGLGKTAQSICAAREIGAERILVICPKTPIQNWHREFRMWWPGGPTPTVLNFDLYSLRKPAPEAEGTMQYPWDLVIIDEAHKLKNPTAMRTKAIYGDVVPHAQRVWLLSGTPTPNDNSELYTHLKALVPQYIRKPNGQGIMSLTDFQETYCQMYDHPHYGRKPRGNRNTKMLREKIAPFFLRRRKAEVLRDLPALTFTDYMLASWDRKAFEAIPQADLPRDVSEEDVLDWLRSDGVHLATERRLTGLAKVPGVIEVIGETLDSGVNKIIVFAYHREVLDTLRQKMQGVRSVQIDGSTPSRDRDAAIQQFQNDPHTSVFLGQITACGEAMTLTASSHVLFAEFSWTPSENYQAACRAHRIGQRDGVLARFLTLPGSIDEMIGRVAARKAHEIAELFS